MAVPSTFADLSTTPASNSGLIADSTAVNTYDDHARTLYAFVASIMANSGNGWTSPYLTVASPSYTGTLTGGTGEVNLGSGQFYKDSSGNVGFGTASPGARVEVSGSGGAAEVRIRSTDTNAANVRAYVNGSEAGKLSFKSDRSLSIETAGSERLSVDSSGNLIFAVNSSAPSLSTNGTVKFELTSNTNLRVSARGSDGVTRSGNITLA